MHHQIIFLNGPPKSGKDRAATIICNEWPSTRHKKFATPLKAGVNGLFSLPADLVRELNKDGNNDLKDVKMPELLGLTYREACIWLSERVMKFRFGEEVFGEIAVSDVSRQHGGPLTVFSDSGFLYEARPVIEHFGIENCHQFRLKRPGCNFEKDSRSYWTYPGLDAVDLDNAHDLTMFRIQVLRRVDKVLGREGISYS